MSRPARLLCICPDAILRPSRHAVLSLRFHVTSIRDVAEMHAIASTDGFDGLVLCHTVGARDCETAALIGRARWPQVKLIVLSHPNVPCLRSADLTISVLNGPAALLDALDTLFRGNRAGRAKPASALTPGNLHTDRAANAA